MPDPMYRSTSTGLRNQPYSMPKNAQSEQSEQQMTPGPARAEPDTPWHPTKAWFRPTLARGIWSIACAYLLFILWVNPQEANVEGLLVPLVCLLALTAPLGWFGMYVLSWIEVAISEALGGAPLPATQVLVFETAVATLLGYWQWFILLPWLWQGRKKRRASRNYVDGRDRPPAP
jgi:uncharacterized membrane protein